MYIIQDEYYHSALKWLYVLFQNKLALPKSRAFSLPGAGFTYGRPNEKRVYTAGDGEEHI